MSHTVVSYNRIDQIMYLKHKALIVYGVTFDLCVSVSQICSQLSERLEKQQTANRGELEKIRVRLHLHKQHVSLASKQ